MPKRIGLRTLTTEEEAEIRRIANSRKEPMRLVQRARVIEAILNEPSLPPSRAGEQAGYKGAPRGIHWVKRFNEEGLSGLLDGDRSGRPPTHSQETRSALLDLALHKESWFPAPEKHDPEIAEKGAHRSCLHGEARENPHDLSGRVGTLVGQNLSWIGVGL